MKKNLKFATAALVVALLAVGSLAWQANAAASSEDAIKEFMKECHKAPKGVDPACKKAVDGKASPEEIKKLVAGYKMLAAAKPPKGEMDSWKDKTSKLYAASQKLAKGGTEAAAAYKEAVNCKACHSAHKPD